MSSSEYEEYLKLVGQAVLSQQVDQQPEQRLSGEQIQRRHLVDRQRAERNRMIEAARLRAARMEQERLREAADQRRINDVLTENQIMQQERQRFLSIAGNLPEDFDALWPARWREIQAERVIEARARSRVLNAF